MTAIPREQERRRSGDRSGNRARELLEIGRWLTSALDLDVLLERILETARELCGARYAALGVLDEDRRELARFLTSGEPPELHAVIGHLPRGRGVLGLLIDEPVPIRLHDVSQHPRSFGFPVGHPPMRSFLGAPIVVRDRVYGNLYLTEKQGAEDFDEGDLEAIVVLSQWAAIAIDNARLFGTSERRRVQLEHAVRGMEAARDIALALGDEVDLDRILSLIVTRARTLVNARSLLIWLVDGAHLRIAAHAGDGFPPTGVSIPREGSTTGATLAGRAPLRIDDVASGLALDPADYGIPTASSALVVPLLFRGRRLGALTAFDHDGPETTFSDEDERALQTFAASAATAVATAHSVEAQRLRQAMAATEAERARWARDLHDQTLQGLGAVKLALQAARRGAGPTPGPQLDVAISQVEVEIAALRGIIADLRPPVLDELGLEPAIRTLAERVAALSGLTFDLALELGERRLDAEIETIAYRVAQEALNNVVKHAGATRVWLRLRASAASLELSVGDDGRGLDESPLGSSTGYGLVGMRERAVIGGGELRVDSVDGGGTVVALALPLDPPRLRRSGP